MSILFVRDFISENTNLVNTYPSSKKTHYIVAKILNNL